MSSLLFGGTALFSKLLPFSANDIILSRSLISSVLLGLFILFTRKKNFNVKSKKDAWFIFLSGLFLGLHLFTYFYAIKVSSIGVGVISLFTFPMITTLIEPVILKTKPKVKDVVLGLFVLLGVFFIISDSGFQEGTVKGVLSGIISAVLYSFRNLIQKYRLNTYSPIPMLFYQMLITFCLMLPFTTFSEFQIQPAEYGWMLILSIFFTIIPHLAVIESLKTLDARSVSLILTLQVFYTIVFAFIIFNEELKLTIIFGSIVVISAVGYESYRVRVSQKRTGGLNS
jgi:drug/metabolite transporter (DMT)-like permease